MKPYYMQVIAVSILMLFVQNASSSQKDDILLVEKLIELYPDVDLSKEAILQTEIIARKHDKDLASILSGRIRYKINQKSEARKSFVRVKKDSQFFKKSILTYYQTAASDDIKDTSGLRESTNLFIDNKLWNEVVERNSDEWELVKQIFKSYSDLNRNDREKISYLKKVLNELDIVIDIDGELEVLISASEKVFLNDWQVTEGKLENRKKLESLLVVLQDLEFGEQNYDFFAAFTNRARVLTILGESSKALELLEKTKSKIIDYDKFLKEHLERKKDLSNEEKVQALSQMSILPQWYYAKAIALFQNFRLEYKKSKEESGEQLFGRHGSVVNLYLCVKKFPENTFSYKSILAYQKLRAFIGSEFSKNMKELSVSDLIQGKAFYIVEDYENALRYLSRAALEKNELSAYNALNLAVGASIKLSKFDDAEKYFKEICEKYSKLNIAPDDFVTKLTNYCVATYLKQAGEAGSAAEKEVFNKRGIKAYKYAKENGKQKSNVSVKYLFVSRILNELLEKNKEEIAAGLADLKPVIKSLSVDHNLAEESVKVSKSLGLVYQKAGQFSEAINEIELYLNRIKTFSSQQTDDQIKMKMFLVELLIGEGNLSKAESYIGELKKAEAKFAAEISSLKVRYLYSKLLKNENEEFRTEYISAAKSHINKYSESKARPFIIAQLAVILQNVNDSEKANELYSVLQKEYPEHNVNQGTGFNQVLALLKSGNGPRALELLSSYEGLAAMKADNLYAVVSKISKTFGKVEMSQDSAAQFLKVLAFLDGLKNGDKHFLQNTALIKSQSLIVLGKFKNSEQELTEVVEKFPQGSYIIDLKLLLAQCYAKQNKFSELSKVYSSLQSMVSRLKGGMGDSSLSIRIAAGCCSLFSEAEDEKYLKKGKYISYLAAQYNVSTLKDSDMPNFEKVEYWNAYYSKILNAADFLELKKSFLKRYPTSKYAVELRKL